MKIKLALDKIMESKKVSIGDIFRKTNLEKSVISRYKNNKVIRYDSIVLAKLCEALNVKPSDLIVLENNKTALAH